MRRIVWAACWVMVGVWTLVAVGTWGAFDLVSGAVRQVGGGDVAGFPIEPWSAAWVIDLLHGLGAFVFVLVWSFVSLLLVGATWLVTALFTRPTPRRLAPPYR